MKRTTRPTRPTRIPCHPESLSLAQRIAASNGWPIEDVVYYALGILMTYLRKPHHDLIKHLTERKKKNEIQQIGSLLKGLTTTLERENNDCEP